ncbi:uncharacterized protein LOC135075239 [Ostrinia nubilalis]|uniref:uncharacterized protein LOC135075239 n=1 Tax=Ostrinia nubilalis TaxID=29057 RepID=UPI0030826A1A
MTSTQEFNCILCKETFVNKEDLQIHFRKHGDPKFNQSLKKNRPQNEAQASAAKKNEEVEMVSCDVCSEMFPTISKAITHKHKMHPDHDAKYFCPWCGKLFTMKHLYNKHLQSNHVDAEQTDDSHFHCDACNVDFFMPSAMLYHNKFFHRQDTDLPSIGQSKKLKMCPQNVVLQIYYCSFCGDEYDNKVNLHKHINDDHSDENQSPEDVLRCPVCDAIFFHLDAYELHITFHSKEDLYSEKNEMFEQLTEFSLETVPPQMEKVENAEPQDIESEMQAVGVETFLERAIGNSLDKTEDEHRVKTKKHKKHKKSKKSAITLNEFLNMNKDVFGEGLDFQGVEEVPRQVVTKRLKQKKPTMAAIKSLESSNLEKLKKQGIIVKMKPTKKPMLQKIVVGDKVLTKIPAIENKSSTQIQSTSDEVLSKLINQSNNQIKIVKKISSQENAEESEENDKSFKTSDDQTNLCERGPTPENIEVECDVNVPSETTSSENEAKEESTSKVKTAQTIAQNNYRDDSVHNDVICPKKEEASASNKSDDDEDRHDHDHVEKDNFNEEKNITQKTVIPLHSKNKLISEKPPCSTISNMEDAITAKNGSINNTEDKTECDLERNSKSPVDQNNTLNALKHLSHLITIKPVSSKKGSAPASPAPTPTEQKVSSFLEPQNDSDLDEKDEIQTPEKQKEIYPEPVKEKNESPLNKLEHLKKLSKNITIKSLSHSPKNDKDMDSDDEEETNNTLEKNASVLNVSNAAKGTCLSKNLDSKSQSSPVTKTLQNLKVTNEKETLKSSNIDLLKHLSNVTAKPVSTIKSKVQESNAPIKRNIVPNLVKKIEKEQEVEIFNIDDSDDEVPSINTPPSKPNVSENTPIKSIEKLKNISQSVNVKSINQQGSPLRKNNVQQIKVEKMPSKVPFSLSQFSEDEDDDNQTLNNLIPPNKQTQALKNDNLQKTLKGLSKHITIKSGIPSPSLSVKSGKDQDPKDTFDEDPDNAGDSDSDSYKGGVKISEITEDNGMSDDDMADQVDMNEIVPVTSPAEPHSDDDDHDFDDDPDGNLSDLEYHIKSSTLKKPTNITAQMLNLQNMNKNITIKSLSEKKGTAPKLDQTKPMLNTDLSIKPFKQSKPETRDAVETAVNKKIKNASQITRSVNQNTASCSQQNTVNKEVTVKTFQTKTVIQEITTTVTKTIKTVNQTVKQEVQNVQSNQRVQGMKSSNQVKNFQGVTVKQATPPAGTKVKGAAVNRPPIGTPVRPSNQLVPVRPSNQMVPVRPSNQIVPIRPSNQIVPVRPSNQIVPVRPCNQLVPVRPATNTARMSRPRMAGPKKAVPSTSGNQQKQFKMSPHAVNTTKRPTDEPAGHFSCFKKPKESLIPVSDIPTFTNDQSSEAVVQYSSSQMSKSNFSSATKTVKGSKVVTSTQMRSEMSASTQQLERLNSMSGLKVVKTSQMKASKVEEKCESSEQSASKRNTLEAIEKLQKQGLLVKKPRLDVSNDSDHSDEDNNYTTEEPDDD